MAKAAVDFSSVKVSIVVPMRNEQRAIVGCLAAFESQTWPLTQLEVLVVDGGSTDGSRQTVEDLASTRPWLRVVDNPAGRASAAFNRGIEASNGDVICLFSAHGLPASDFVERSVRSLESTGAAGVGGAFVAEGATPRSTAIGLALASPFGMASPFRYATELAEVDTVGHPAYRRAALDDVGGFNEVLERNSDYEFNWRLRQAGHRLMIDPSITSVYVPRPDLRSLAVQFWHYGASKAVVLRSHPRSLRPRQLAPPAFTVWLAAAPLLLARPWPRRLFLASLVAYLTMVAAATVKCLRDRGTRDVDVPTLVLAFPTMHLSWGAGLLWSSAKLLAGSQKPGTGAAAGRAD